VGGEALPGTTELVETADQAMEMVDGIHRYLNKATKEIQPPRFLDPKRLGELLGTAADPLEASAGFEPKAGGTVEWPVFRNVRGEGWLLEPDLPAKAAVVIFPAIDAPAAAFPIAEAFRQSGARVLVLARIGRQDGPAGLPGVRQAKIDRREFVWRAGYELGRSLTGYETQIALAGIRALQFGRKADQAPLPVGLIAADGKRTADFVAALCDQVKAIGYYGKVPAKTDFLDEIIWASQRELGGFPEGSKLMLFPDSGFAEPDASNKSIGGPMTTLGLDRNKPGPPKVDPPTPASSLPNKPLADRCYLRILEDTQHLMREAEYARAAFWKKADFSNADAFAKSAVSYRDHFRQEVVGELPVTQGPANLRSRKIYDTEKLTGWEVKMDVLPDVFAYGTLLIPKGMKPGEKRPVIVCQHGLEGRPADLADPAKDHPAYHAYGARLCERGYIVFAPQNPYIGEERFRSICSFILRQHETILKWLASREDVEAGKIAFYGLSYGGKTAMRMPALLDGYCLSICSADYNEWIWKNCSARAQYSYLYTQEYDMLEWNLGNTFNYAELSWLIFPRPFMVERGHQDGVSCDEWVAYEFAKTFRHYNKLGLGDRAKIEFFDGPHTIHGVGTFEFLDRWLKTAQTGP
jgi:hypothetical protein